MVDKLHDATQDYLTRAKNTISSYQKQLARIEKQLADANLKNSEQYAILLHKKHTFEEGIARLRFDVGNFA